MSGDHPQRYPKHDNPDKGQVYGGECNRTACTNRNAVFWNLGTFGLYCPSCAKAINWDARPGGFHLCIRVDAKPTLDRMEPMKREHGYYEAEF